MTEAQIKLWREMAKKDNVLEDYDYHLGMMNDPLPYKAWKIKFDALNTLQSIPESDPRYFSDYTFKREQELCNALGY